MPGDELPWIAGIRAFEDEVPDGEAGVAAWRVAIGGWGIELRDGGELIRELHGEECPLGTWALFGPAPEVDAALAGCDVGCPLVGPRVGALAFDVFSWADQHDRHELFHGLAREGRDGVAHRASGRSWPALALRRHQLDHCVGKYSFSDGDALLTHGDGAYAEWIRGAFAAPLQDAGYLVHLSWPATSHNNLRLSHHEEGGRFYGALLRETRRGWRPVGRERTVDRILSRFSAEFWLHDFSAIDRLVDDVELWT